MVMVMVETIRVLGKGEKAERGKDKNVFSFFTIFFSSVFLSKVLIAVFTWGPRSKGSKCGTVKV